MHRHSFINRFSQILFRWLYYYAQFLGVINCRFDRQKKVMRRATRWTKRLAVIFRLAIVIVYCGVQPNLYRKFYEKSDNFTRIFSSLQIASVSIFSICFFIMQIREDGRILTSVNQIFRLFQRIAGRTDSAGIVGLEFLLMVLLKATTTLIGYVSEIPAILQVDNVGNLGQLLSTAFGVYMWLGSMCVLDGCFLGFLSIAAMYERMEAHIKNTLRRMINMESKDRLGSLFTLSRYQVMQLLCDYADGIDEYDAIYSEIYRVTKRFKCIFEWQILFYIYYNFMVVLMLLYHSIWLYLNVNLVDTEDLLMVAVKILNLALLITCVDNAAQKSRASELLCLDLMLSDIDQRWDMSVERFLSQRQAESLEIKLLGFFAINNGFIILVLSAIISYVFILIQFGVSGGFEERNSTVLTSSLQNPKL